MGPTQNFIKKKISLKIFGCFELNINFIAIRGGRMGDCKNFFCSREELGTVRYLGQNGAVQKFIINIIETFFRVALLVSENNRYFDCYLNKKMKKG